MSVKTVKRPAATDNTPIKAGTGRVALQFPSIQKYSRPVNSPSWSGGFLSFTKDPSHRALQP